MNDNDFSSAGRCTLVVLSALTSWVVVDSLDTEAGGGVVVRHCDRLRKVIDLVMFWRWLD